METIESLRRKIAVSQDLQEVVKTMKTLAAVSIRQYEKAVVSLRQYSRTVEMGMQIVMRSRREESPQPRTAPSRRLGAIIFGSELGMCGQFNELLVSYTLDRCNELQVAKNDRSIVAVGARAVSRLEETGEQVESYFAVPGSVSGITSRVQELLLKIETWQCPGGIERIMLFHHQPVSGAIYRPKAVPLLPIDMEWLESLGQKPWPSRVLPTFTMARPRLVYTLLGQHLFVSLYRAFAESLASENAARLAAMQAAENNIEERLKELRLRYNQLRQSTITEELLDIVAGFEALTGKNP
ncbi:MAG: F0F1 ATP synthase subunit gamma [Syntrophobacterales bacterium]|jgi:F-type H+-transporting ATPase subunit gamma|nr:F0F1 ATP synthase subunit gamma [Syntrophobacterales bacterium]